jgi:hypothetical protein
LTVRAESHAGKPRAGWRRFLKGWEKERESLGEIIEPAAPKTGR